MRINLYSRGVFIILLIFFTISRVIVASCLYCLLTTICMYNNTNKIINECGFSVNINNSR